MTRYRFLRPPLFLLLGLGLVPMSCSRERPADPPGKIEPAKADAGDAERDRLDKEIAGHTEAIRHDANQANARGELAYHKRAAVYADKGEYDKAIADYTEAIRLYPIAKTPYFPARLMEAHYQRGMTYKKMREFDKAIADFTEASQPAGGSIDAGEALMRGGFAASAYYQRGLCHDEKGDHAKAMADYREAVRTAPDILNTNEDLKRRMAK